MTLSLHNLTYHQLIKGINLVFEPGHIHGILGPNGAGKSTLLKTMSGIWNPTAGSVTWKGNNLLTCPRTEISRILSLVPQNPQTQFDISAEEMVSLGRYCHGKSRVNGEIIESSLHAVDAIHLRDALLSRLSGGEKQRIYIARSLATEAPVLLLDEPTAHLDLRHQIDIWRLMRQLADQGRTIITTVHYLKAASRYCDKVQVLKGGYCLGSGGYEEIMKPALLKEVFRIKQEEI